MRSVIEPLSSLRRQINRDLFTHGAQQRAAIIEADRQQRQAAAFTELAEIGNVRDLSPVDYRKACASVMRLLRLSR